MVDTLENPHFQLVLDPATASWSLTSREGRFPPLQDVSMLATYRLGRKRFLALQNWLAGEVSDVHVATSPHGTLRQMSLALPPDEAGLRFTLTFALPDLYPLLLWKMAIENTGSQPVCVDRLELMRVQPFSWLGADPATREPAFYSNGWQSWNYSGAYGSRDRPRRTRLGPLAQPLCVNRGTPYAAAAGRFGSDMFGVLGDRLTRTAWLAGFLSQRQHFGSLDARLAGSPSLRLWANGDGALLQPGTSITTDWACLHFLDVDSVDPLAPYLDAVSREHKNVERSTLNVQRSIPIGWCSWYHFFQKVTADDLRQNLQAAITLGAEIPLQMIQLDDGFETQVGDWFTFNNKFPDGVAPLAAEIRSAGFTPGLWLAPFIVHPKSRLAADHTDWLLRGKFNRTVNAGFIWNTFTTALDLTIPDALQYACDAVQTAVHEWGFPFLKLDFLYAAALPGRYRDPTRTRAQVLRSGLEALRLAAGNDTTLLGCGCPLGSAIGVVDAMRVSPDVDPRWHPAFFGTEFFFKPEPNMPSARNATHNSLVHAPLHKRWWINDPDCLLLRPDSRLTLDEVQTLATVIALSGGTLLLSDHLPDIPPERLRIAKQLLPLIGQRPRLLDWFDAATPSRLRLDLENSSGGWHLLALFNWEDEARQMMLDLADFDLPPGEYYAREFWQGEIYRIVGESLALKEVPAHGVNLLAVRPVSPGKPQYIGSNLHISQGLEVETLQTLGVLEILRVCLARPGCAQGALFLALPLVPHEVTVNGDPADWQSIGVGCYRVAVEFERTAQVEVVW